MDKLYYIENCGCDDTTCGLVRISDEDFPKFKSFVENLNRNSTYGCMPKIYLYEIEDCDVVDWDERWHGDWNKLYLDGKVYAVSDRVNSWTLKPVVGEGEEEDND